MFTCSLIRTALSLWINPTGSVDLEPNLLLMHDFKRIKLTCCCSSRLRVRELIVQTVLLVKYDVLSIDVGVYSCQGCDYFFILFFSPFPSPFVFFHLPLAPEVDVCGHTK